jgi:hypothetical protein
MLLQRERPRPRKMLLRRHNMDIKSLHTLYNYLSKRTVRIYHLTTCHCEPHMDSQNLDMICKTL